MHTELECLACFLKQAVATARLSTEDEALRRRVVCETGSLLSRLDLALSPPENAVAVYGQIAAITGERDPFRQLKQESNTFALELRSRIRGQIAGAADPLYAAARYAIAGNIIDYGAHNEFDAVQTLSRCLDNSLAIDDFALLRRDLEGEPKDILYLADNCGEIVFDGLLVEQLQQQGHRVVLGVRGAEILNDVTVRDVSEAGVHDLCPVISNGTSCPGTPLRSCSNELREAFRQADLIISKGQGNFETLSEVNAPLYFLLTVKCGVVARHISVRRTLPEGLLQGDGEMILMKMERYNG